MNYRRQTGSFDFAAMTPGRIQPYGTRADDDDLGIRGEKVRSLPYQGSDDRSVASEKS